jgi:predicted Holliday junction resolvase-like endonuclease
MTDGLLQFFAIQRNIFGLCPCCTGLFRLSDCKVYLRTKPQRDWMDALEATEDSLDRMKTRIDETEGDRREKAREAGRRTALAAIKKIDPIFAPRRLNADDAKVLFHPVDYVVFCGMKETAIKEIVFLDRETTNSDRRRLQNSIEKVIESGQYEWLTIRVKDDGTIVEE